LVYEVFKILLSVSKTFLIFVTLSAVKQNVAKQNGLIVGKIVGLAKTRFLIY